MKRKNEWEKLAVQAPVIQKSKNNVLNGKVLKLVNEYSSEGKKVFDYGCGWGEFAQLLCESGYDVSAFDQADEMVQMAKEKFSDPSFMFREEFEKRKKKMKEKFDIVVSNLVLCILSQEDQNKMLENINKLVKKDGTIVLSLCHPCFDYLPESILSKRKSEVVARYDQEFKYEKKIKENEIEFHDYHRPLSYYSQLFKSHGLQMKEIQESEIFGTSYFPDFIIFVLKLKD